MTNTNRPEVIRAMLNAWPVRVTCSGRPLTVNLNRATPARLDADASATYYLLTAVAS